MMNTALSHLTTEALMERIRRAGLRVTPQRLEIYRALAATSEHPSVQTLFEQLQGRLPGLSHATIYNTLEMMAQLGLVQEVNAPGDNAARYDANVSPHAHLMCRACGRVEDFSAIPLEEPDPRVAELSGYEVRAVGITYYGRCPACRAIGVGE
jgi:Fur family peroxide stress response transcriptional regulator